MALEGLTTSLISNAIFFIAIPWCIWVTASLFNQRQELALLKLIFESLKEMVKQNRPSTDP